MGQFSNISLSRYRRILLALGLEHLRTNGGHEIWAKSGMTRPVVLQTHIDPVPEMIVKNNNSSIGISTKDFSTLLKSIK